MELTLLAVLEQEVVEVTQHPKMVVQEILHQLVHHKVILEV
tara:strand:+ start:71 stop:193 length:123 start_codon:yes stop_codon:yes gene_type:complete